MPLLDSHPKKHLQTSSQSIRFVLKLLEQRASSPEFLKRIVTKLGEIFPKNNISAHMFGGLTQSHKSFEIHRDTMDVLYLQVLGDIEWSVWEPTNPAWYTEDSKDTMQSNQGKRIFSERLTMGKMIWIPRGVYHLVNPYSSRLGISFGVEGNPEPSMYV
jgi:ribosomal protein L16 Arg81 hydroxylase